ncbi:MAG: hypothetical protein GXP24_06755, partial [Planctomycetes bacterium]|nr:hypothetical protein [Planctomycetota bacterium]
IAKIPDGNTLWHRMGDVGYFDEQGRFWYCGRKAQRIRHGNGDLFTVPIESVFNSLPNVKRTALVGVGPDQGRPVLVVEFEPSYQTANTGQALWDQWSSIEPRIEEIWYGEHSFTSFPIILIHKCLPTDVRHNAKINREQLAAWATEQLASADR